MMIEADVLLRGQYTADQQMTPVMASLPDTTSDVTLVEWLALVKGRGKGLKLDFKSIEAVEISLQRLNDVKEEVHFSCRLTLYNTIHYIRYDSVYLMCSKKLTGSQLSPPHGKCTSLVAMLKPQRTII